MTTPPPPKEKVFNPKRMEETKRLLAERWAKEGVDPRNPQNNRKPQ
jgi:hypothetical protein